jgi:hypothetical protein
MKTARFEGHAALFGQYYGQSTAKYLSVERQNIPQDFDNNIYIHRYLFLIVWLASSWEVHKPAPCKFYCNVGIFKKQNLKKKKQRSEGQKHHNCSTGYNPKDEGSF